MPTIPPKGDQHDFYSSADGPDIGVFPASLIPDIPEALPIRLQRGDRTWGARHIATKHGHWLDKQKLDVHEMIWVKVRQHGSIFTTEENGKLKVSLKIHPSALLILRVVKTASETFMTVVSVYFHPNSLDGTRLGAYQPLETLPPGTAVKEIPLFSLPAPPPAPTVIYKKTRTFVLPADDKEQEISGQPDSAS